MSEAGQRRLGWRGRGRVRGLQEVEQRGVVNWLWGLMVKEDANPTETPRSHGRGRMRNKLPRRLWEQWP